MFVVFEGIDGSGKTTLSNRVANRLRDAGLVVKHVREGGQFASSVTQAMRELGRDCRNLALTPRAELLLYLAREVQLFDEVTQPALAQADIVIADRFVATAEALAIHGRGLASAEVTPLITNATGGFQPDLTVLIDIEPRIARARRDVAKLATATRRPPSRKGMAGRALQRRLREGYRALAARDAERWVVVDNTDSEVEPTVAMLVDLVEKFRRDGIAAARARVPTARRSRDEARDPASARSALLAWIDERARTEPALAAYFVDGLADPEFDERRLALATSAPHVIAAGLKYMTDAVTWRLRHQLADIAPEQIAKSLVGDAATSPDADALLHRLAQAVPVDVAAALQRRDDSRAWALRDMLPVGAVMRSLGGVGSERAWQRRDAWLNEAQLDDPQLAALACASISGIAGERAWRVREAARPQAPVAALESTTGLVDERAWRWRQRLIKRAPKIVMKSIAGLADAPAWELRAQAVDVCEEVMDSIVGLDEELAWQLRERVIDHWPASAIKSLGPLAWTERGRTIVLRALERGPSDPAVWRQAVLAGNRSHPGGAPTW
jgi:dTMP kinase